MIAKFGRSPKFRFSRRATIAEQVVNEHGAMRNEAVVANGDEVADERVGLNPAPLADGCTLLYLNERSDESFIADFTAIQVCRFYYGHIRAEPYVDDPDRTAPDWIHFAEL
jgi:hypothetical protein